MSAPPAAADNLEYNSAPCGYHSVDTNGIVVRMNDTELRWLGYSREEVVGKLHIGALVAGMSRDELEAAFAEFKQRGLVQSREVSFRRKDGSVFPVLVSSVAVKDEAGRFSMSRSVVFDISQRRRAEEELRAREEQIRTIVESAHEAFVSMDRNGVITGWNRKAEETFGWRRQEAVGRPLAETIVPERLRPFHRRGLERFLATGEGPVLGKRLELTALRRDGGEFPIELTISSVRSAGGEVSFNAFVHDISERKQAERALRESELRSRLLFEKSPLPMWAFDLQTLRFLEVNERASVQYGYSREEFLELKASDLRPPELLAAFEEDLRRFREKPGIAFTSKHRKKTGTVIDVEIWWHAIRLHNRPAALAIVQDVTQRKRAAEERERLIEDLEAALAQVKTLRGMIPICAACKKVRDDAGYWHQVEVYLRERSDATFTHGLCPDCVEAFRRGEPGSPGTRRETPD
jgi:PAS domain S-box-containing protein